MKTITEQIIRHDDKSSSCPCGCGGTAMDRPATRLRLLRDESGAIGDQLAIDRSVDGGATWFGCGWHALANELTAKVAAHYGFSLQG